VTDVASYDGDHLPETTVRHGLGYASAAAARVVASHITGGAVIEFDPTMEEEDGVVVITGADFTTIHDQPAPKGSPDDLRSNATTTTEATAGGDGGGGGDTTTTSTTVPETTTTTVIGYSTGEPPEGVDCG
jgi:hypothetical protein